MKHVPGPDLCSFVFFFSSLFANFLFWFNTVGVARESFIDENLKQKASLLN